MLNELPFQQEQLNFLTGLAEQRTDFLNPIFVFLNYFDTIYFAAFLVPLVWFGFSYRGGVKLTYIFLVSGIVNCSLKYFFGLPRPTVAIPEIGIFLFKSPGFPSGGAQTAFLLGSILISRYKNLPITILGVFYILLISFSRLYLGVHYPIDILGGWIAGSLIFLSFLATEKPIEQWLSNRTNTFPYYVIGISLLLIFFIPIYPLIGTVLAINIGFVIALKYHLYSQSPKLFWKKLLKGVGAGATTLLFGFLASRIAPAYIVPILLGFWVSLGIPLLIFNRDRHKH